MIVFIFFLLLYWEWFLLIKSNNTKSVLALLCISILELEIFLRLLIYLWLKLKYCHLVVFIFFISRFYVQTSHWNQSNFILECSKWIYIVENWNFCAVTIFFIIHRKNLKISSERKIFVLLIISCLGVELKKILFCSYLHYKINLYSIFHFYSFSNYGSV